MTWKENLQQQMFGYYIIFHFNNIYTFNNITYYGIALMYVVPFVFDSFACLNICTAAITN